MHSSSAVSSWNSSGGSIKCGCNMDCVIYTTRRGENTGRRFYRCPRYNTPETCDFFKWIDDATQSTVNLTYQAIALQERQLASVEEQLKELKAIRCYVKSLFVTIIVIIVLYFVI
ncbi:hypothetical protein AXF42_Ash015270 [Apostasia shenzhenica]|uniref:GRF-type domain-containing protein n=1 Tax=Apostasia shenzhenica TaxID=1088818 RepID=A0A2I0ALS2_9ASPA|nr:hypothetical protein AXF42_Ash015270 [Apostasia shenzhenica]